jgi:putative transposase
MASPIRYTERQADAGIDPSVGSVDDSYDNSLAETINGLYKIEVTGSWCPGKKWINNRRLLEPIGDTLPAEAYYPEQENQAMVAGLR